MQDAAIVAGLVPADFGLLLQNRDACTGKPLVEPIGCRKADDAAADNNDTL